MKITELAIKKPIAMIMIIMFFVVLGLFGYQKIGSDLFPKADTPIVTITSIYPGAGPEEMENQVVDDIEEAVASLNGLKSSKSWIYEGMSFTVLEFTMSTDPDMAAIDAQKAVDKVMIKLPKDVEKPIIQKVDMNAEPILSLAVSGNRPINELHDIVKDTIKNRLETVPGVATINMVGGQQQQVRISLDRFKTEAYGLSVNQIIQLLNAENLNVPSGNIKGETLQYDVRLVAKFKTLADIQNLPVPIATGSTIRLKDIAKVELGFSELDQFSRLTQTSQNKLISQDAIGITILKQSGASVVDTVQAVRQELAVVQKMVPQDIKIAVSDDTSTYITNSLDDTKRTLVEGVLMTGLVLFFFLKEWRSVVIVMLAIPTSIVATFMMMYFFGFTFNMLSLMGLSLCVGILVDDSIVVLENIHRHLKMGKSPMQAALDGRKEIGMAAVAITLSDVVVFGPIAFMQGMVGQFFKEFGLTVVVATLFSLFISFTLTPMLAAYLYKHQPADASKKSKGSLTWLSRTSGRIGDFILDFYRRILVWSLNHRLKVVSIVVVAVIASSALIPAIGFEFLPKSDQGKFKVTVEMSPGTTLNETNQVVQDIEQKISTIPDISHVFTTVGTQASNLMTISSSHLAKLDVVLKPKQERQRTVWQVADLVRSWSNQFPGATIQVQEAQMAGLNNFEAPVVIELTGPDLDVLAKYSKEMLEIVRSTPGTTDVSSSWKDEAKPEYQVVIDRDKTAAVGLTAGEIAQALRAAVAGEVASKLKIDNKDIDIWVQLEDANRKSVDDLKNITVANRFGQTYQIKQLAEIVPAEGPTEIRHKNRERMITILSNYKDASLSELVKTFDAGFAKLDLPHGYSIEYDGLVKQMNESNSDLGQAAILALVLVYMILVILYESFLTPFIRMLSLPVGIIGASIGLLATHNTLNIMSLIGVIMLEGLAAKNGTLLIDYTNTLMGRGIPLREALLEAGTKRLRPIFMTSTTMIFGMLPTALALADGAEIRVGMGIVLIGGMITSTVLTPILLPVAYTLLDDFRKLFVRKGSDHSNITQ